MPAELFPIALAGGILLLCATLLARSRRVMIGAGLAIAIATLMGGPALAAATGLASGRTEPAGWPWALVLGSFALYTLAIIATGVAGILLARDVFRPEVRRPTVGAGES